MAVTVDFDNVSFDYHKSGPRVLEDLTFRVEPGEFLVFLGPSGCGKSTTMMCAAGLLTPSAGSIALDGVVVSDGERKRLLVPPERRRIGMVFQSYALWPHMTVRKNVALPLVFGKVPSSQREARIRGALELVRCEELIDRYPGQLSGGQQQRVALARALVAEPGLVLFDEPLSNLDAMLRADLRTEIARLQRTLGFTAIYVTHDHTEALSLATRIAIMEKGRVAQVGTPTQIWRGPATAYVARFLGAQMISAQISANGSGHRVDTPVGTYEMPTRTAPTGDALMAVFPSRAVPASHAGGTCTVENVSFLGSHHECVLTSDGDANVRLTLQLEPRQPVPRVGDRVAVTVSGDDLLLYEVESGQRIE